MMMYDWHFEPDTADIAANNGYDLGLRGGEAYKTESKAIWHGKRWICLLYTSPSPRDRG